MESFRLLASQGRSSSRFFRNPGLNLLLSIQEVGVAWGGPGVDYGNLGEGSGGRDFP